MSRSAPVRSARRRSVVMGVVASAALLTVATACSSSKKADGGSASTSPAGASSAAAAGGDMIEVKNFSFTPTDLSVAVGTKVTWKFDDDAKHNVKSDDGTFKSDNLSGGKTYDFTFTKAGTYTYICTIHQYMKGTVTVK